MNRTNRRIAEESKQKIGNALFTLMKVYHFREITVTQLTQEAELSRKTFYRLFNDKDEVLNIVFDTLFYEFLRRLRHAISGITGILCSFTLISGRAGRRCFSCWAKTICWVGCLNTSIAARRRYLSPCAHLKKRRSLRSRCPISWLTAWAVCTVCSSNG